MTAELVARSLSYHTAVPASLFNFEQLAAIYNEARVDYIVPMPMNAPRMEAYVREHDVDLNASVVALNRDDAPIGLGMLGLRGARGWITRLGVMPAHRGHHSGEFIMRTLLQNAVERAAARLQLEVIIGNEPAYRLFLKLGFQPVRELRVIRRPPGRPNPGLPAPDAVIVPLRPDEIAPYLNSRTPGAAWIEETRSILHAGKLKGFAVQLPSGQGGWMIFQCTLFQLAHFVLSTEDEDTAYALLHSLHQQYPAQDTKVENIPADDPLWPVFQRIGYVEAFRRIEMALPLA